MTTEESGDKLQQAGVQREYMARLRLEMRDPSKRKLIPRAKITLIHDQLKEARTGEFTFLSDEHTSRDGTNMGPAPLQYFMAALGF